MASSSSVYHVPADAVDGLQQLLHEYEGVQAAVAKLMQAKDVKELFNKQSQLRADIRKAKESIVQEITKGATTLGEDIEAGAEDVEQFFDDSEPAKPPAKKSKKSAGGSSAANGKKKESD